MTESDQAASVATATTPGQGTVPPRRCADDVEAPDGPGLRPCAGRETRPPISVLIVSPGPRGRGGVVTFVEMVKAHLRNSRVSTFAVGSAHTRRENPITVLLRILVTPFRIAMLVRRARFDLVHINPSLREKSLLRDGLILLALRVARFQRVLICFHGWDRTLERKIDRFAIARKLLTWLLNGAARIMVLSPDFRSTLIDWGVDPALVSLTRTMFDGESLRMTGPDRAASGPASILYLSRFERTKGVYELLEAFGRVAHSFPDIDLVMAGDGPERPGLEARAAELGVRHRVQFPGFVGGTEKARLLLECGVFALPTYYGEGMPISLLEAMGAGKPVLTAKDGVIPHIVSDPENGVVLDRVTVEAVEQGLRRLLSDPSWRRAAGERNADYAWKRFEAAQVVAEIEDAYAEIAGRAATGR